MFPKRGFTLVEEAIVLVIVALIMTGALQLMKTLRDNNQLRQTREQVEAAKEAVIGFAAANGRLPHFASTATPADEFSSLLKVKTDVWGNNIVYIYDASLETSNTSVCGIKTTGIQLLNCNATTGCSASNICSAVTPTLGSAVELASCNVAFAIFSQGPNSRNQTATGSNPPSGFTHGGKTPTTPASPFITYSAGVKVGNFDSPASNTADYDDVLTYVTLEELRQKAGCVGKQLRISNNELPYGFAASPYNATIYADGGVPFPAGGSYRWCLQGTLPTGISATPVFAPVADCATTAEASWVQGDTLILSATAAGTANSYQLIIFVRDNADASGNNDNIASKSFVITVNP